MTAMNLDRAHEGDRTSTGALTLAVFGCLYWLLFVLVLEPDNLLRAWRLGHPLSLGREALRMMAAALLGAAATPIPLALTRRFPLAGDRLRRNLLIHLVAAALLALLLVVVGCVVAAWGFEGEALPSTRELSDQVTANWTLLVFVVCGFTLIVQLLDQRRASEPSAVQDDQATGIFVVSGARLRRVEATEVDWIEGQGNYAALHAGSRTHLIRKTLKNLEATLDAARFVRIHRGAIVAIDRIREISPLTNGDAILTLSDGRELRVSRSYRESVRRRWLGA